MAWAIDNCASHCRYEECKAGCPAFSTRSPKAGCPGSPPVLPFTPEFYRSCIKCGFAFGEGIEPPELEQREALNSRVVFVTVGVLLLRVGLLGFCALVLRD